VANLIDGDLLTKARAGNQRAIKAMLHHLEESLRPQASTDEAIGWLLEIINRISEGEEPNAAFNYAKGRPPLGYEFERWTWARSVKTLMEDHDMTQTAAIMLVGKATGKSGVNGTIQDAWDQYRDIESPESLFPIPPEAMDRIRFFEQHLEKELRRYLKKP